MARIAFTWEWGAGSGHLRLFSPIAEDLVAKGHEVTVVSRDLARTWDLFPPTRFRALPCPVLSVRPKPALRRPVNVAQLAWNLGFHKESEVVANFRVWRDLFDLLRPEVVISDFGLASVAVAESLGAMTLRIGNGYVCPPCCDPPAKFDFDAGQRPHSDHSGESEEFSKRVLVSIHRSLQRVGLPASPAWTQLLVPPERTLLSTIPPLDPYRSQRDGSDYLGFWEANDGDPPVWPEFGDATAFAYLKPFRALPELLTELTAASLGTVLVGDRVPDSQRPSSLDQLVRVQEGLVDLKAIQGKCRFAVCNANHGVTVRLLTLGVPILAVPLYLEQRLTASAIERAGCGIAVAPNHPAGFRTAIDRLKHDDTFSEAAAAFAEKYRGYGEDGLHRALQKIDSLIG